MSDRLSELLRQRAAIQAHLDWLDREIAGARPVPSDKSPRILPLPATPSPTPNPSIPASDIPDPDAILAGYRQNTQDLRTDVRKGCLLYFFAAFFLLGLGIAAFYLVNRLVHQSTPPSEIRANPDKR